MDGSRPSKDPLAACDLVVSHFFGLEPEGNFASGGFRTIAAVDEIVLFATREIASDRPGSGGGPVCRAEEGAKNCDRFVSFQNADNDRATSDEVDQATEKWLAVVFRIVLLAQRTIDLDELERGDAEPFGLDTCENRTDQPALDTIGLENDQGALHGRHGLGEEGIESRKLIRDMSLVFQVGIFNAKTWE